MNFFSVSYISGFEAFPWVKSTFAIFPKRLFLVICSSLVVTFKTFTCKLFALPYTKAWNTCSFFSTIACVFGSAIELPQLDGENSCYRLLYLVLVQIFLMIKLQWLQWLAVIVIFGAWRCVVFALELSISSVTSPTFGLMISVYPGKRFFFQNY